MPLPKTLARINRRITNPVFRPVAGWIPGACVLHHVGRTSGRRYSTPMNVFTDGDRFVIALTYGAGTDWVKNVQASGGCQISYRGAAIALVDPQFLSREEGHRAVPAPVRFALDRINATEFLALHRP